MSAALLLSCLTVAAPPDGPAVGSPRLARGDELVYRGEIVEAGTRVVNPFRKHYELEVRVFVLDVRTGSADCAVLTSVRPLHDPVVAEPVAAVTGVDPARRQLPPAVTLELVRVDDRGRVVLLAPPAGPAPIPLSASTATKPAPLTPLDTVPTVELGMFLPLPAKPAAVGVTWAAAEPGRPPVVWTCDEESVWNGGRCIAVTATQQTDGWDRPAIAVTGWQRTEALLVVPADGFASKVRRHVKRREGDSTVGWVEVRYELQPPNRYVGLRYDDVRREVEAAYAFASDLAPLLAKANKVDPRQFEVKLSKIVVWLEEQSAATGFRPALEAVRRRCEAAAHGDATPALAEPPAAPREPPRVGRPAPDFVAPLVHAAGQFRLSAVRGRPAVLVFFKPGSKTSRGSLSVAEALYKLYADRLAVVALAVSAGPEEASRQREALTLTVPVADGSGPRPAYVVDTYPKFFVVDAAGSLAWRFDGYGAETGYLAKVQVEKLLNRGNVGGTTGATGTTWATIRRRLGLSGPEPAAYD
ncbi:MAG TPA: redoxin domain-containing protein [Fimbriiglobus sp.]|nr:redoxin domain-containing protein [Fimbriiglobus sp.]